MDHALASGDVTFFEDPEIHHGFIAGNRSRLVAAGIDPAEYDEVTAAIGHIRDWPDVLIAAGENAADVRTSALWYHFATIVPDLSDVRREDAAENAQMMPGGFFVFDRDRAEGFRGVLRGRGGEFDAPPARGTGRHARRTRPTAPADFRDLLRGKGPLVVLVPGMNSTAVEFTGVAEELVRHGLCVLSIDGPGQGATPGDWQPEYERVVARALDAVGAESAGLWGMSMGGWLATRAAAHESRIRALVAVSGPAALEYDDFVPYVSETFDLRTNGKGREFAASVDASSITLDVPVRVVEGGRDIIPGVTPLTGFGERHDGLVVIEEGNHLIEEHRDEWLPQTAAWMAEALRTVAA